ncbi:MAG: methyl-accepting chemotaxis protein, partial [Desulfohalobiaceae bacterium]|nr:methyl-accepting chemotaxis protein [Desulfohalobiaceae bacterium]
KQLGSIQESSTKVNTLIGEIAAASKEQAQGIDQVNTAVSEMDKVVQQNAADSEESASASEELSSQAEELKKMVHELTGLIGGKKGQTEQHAAQKSTARRAAGRSKGLPQHKQQKTSGGNAQSGKQSRQKQDSEQVIPLDDSDFKDF